MGGNGAMVVTGGSVVGAAVVVVVEVGIAVVVDVVVVDVDVGMAVVEVGIAVVDVDVGITVVVTEALAIADCVITEVTAMAATPSCRISTRRSYGLAGGWSRTRSTSRSSRRVRSTSARDGAGAMASAAMRRTSSTVRRPSQ